MFLLQPEDIVYIVSWCNVLLKEGISATYAQRLQLPCLPAIIPKLQGSIANAIKHFNQKARGFDTIANLTRRIEAIQQDIANIETLGITDLDQKAHYLYLLQHKLRLTNEIQNRISILGLRDLAPSERLRYTQQARLQLQQSSRQTAILTQYQATAARSDSYYTSSIAGTTASLSSSADGAACSSSGILPRKSYPPR